MRVPKQGGWVGHYEKFNRIAQGWALVGVAALVKRENGTITAARVALTNMGSTPVRATATEEALAGADSREAIGAAAARVAEGTRPSDDMLGQRRLPPPPGGGAHPAGRGQPGLTAKEGSPISDGA